MAESTLVAVPNRATERVVGARIPLTTFVGRRLELIRLRSLVAGSRLVTITGPGGSGKTRLVEHFVASLARSLNGGVGFAYLASTRTPLEVVDAVAGSIGLRGRAGEPGALIIDYLRARPYLLAIDNCEHVQDTVARLVSDLLQACPGIRILATSRRPLLVPGEQLFPLAGLHDAAAVSLFVDRAQRASPAFELSDADWPIVADLCARLDGMPLAIELAAARTRHLGLATLARRVAGHLADLDSGSRSAPERQRSLRGAITWSHDLLGDAQSVLWRRLCFFSGGFTLAAAERVASIAPLDRDRIEPLLGDLVDQSMVVFDIERDRYRVIEAMREFGLERLREAGEESAVAARHRAWMVERAEVADRSWFGPDQAAFLDEMAAEGENLRAALESCRAAGAHEDGLRLSTASLWYWVTRASLGEAARWFETFLGRSPEPGLAARASWRAGYVAVLQGRHAQARTLLQRADRLAELAGDPPTRAYARMITCLRVMYERSEEDALALAREGLADPAAEPMCRCWALIGIGLASFLRQDWEECRRASLAGIAMCDEVGETWNKEIHLRSLAYAEWQLGDPRAAESTLFEALRIDRRLDDVWHLAWTTETLAWVSVDLRRDERAARLLGMAAGFWSQSGSGLAGPWQAFHAAATERLQGRLGGRRLAREMAAGTRLDRAAGLTFALDERPAAVLGRGDGAGLSPREAEIARLVGDGLVNREIGERLFLSPRTVEKHVEHVMNKLAVGSRAEIAAWQGREQGRPTK
ncbi:MAG TPA: LuxR C-terminal-related transcriptional regulator [Candidatus Limnocylindrales bacterium]|nr:LuxR C-terminal-related transcriptional regulator [Candidatus Limnocylindrales bacterium]